MPKFGRRFVRAAPVLLPHDAERGTVDAEADGVAQAVYGYVAD